MALWSFSGSFINSWKNYASKSEYCRIIHEKTSRALFDLKRPRQRFLMCSKFIERKTNNIPDQEINIIKDSIRVQLPVLKLGICFFFCIFLITQVSFLIQKCSTRTGLYLPAETSGTTSTTLKESM